MRIHFGTPEHVSSIRDAIRHYDASEFESPTRSTIPMLSLLHHSPDVFNGIVRKLGIQSDYDAYLEYKAGPFRGNGKPSHTDVMLRSGPDSLAIEAKWTEPMYALVKDWPKRGQAKTENQSAVLQGWIDTLASRLGRNLYADQFGDVVDQMLHRAASAAHTGDHPRLAYFLFKPGGDARTATADEIRAALQRLWDLLEKPSQFPFYAVEIEATPLPCYEDLRLLPKGEEATAEAVIAALQDTAPLFRFSNTSITQVGVASKA